MKKMTKNSLMKLINVSEFSIFCPLKYKCRTRNCILCWTDVTYEREVIRKKAIELWIEYGYPKEKLFEALL